MPEYERAVEQLRAQGAARQKLIIGGKSMGGRVASLVADELFAAGLIDGPGVPRLPVPSAGQARRTCAPRTWRLCVAPR